MIETRPESDVELYGDEALLNPFGIYRELRDIGPAVWLTKYDMFALPRYKDVREALKKLASVFVRARCGDERANE